MRAVGDDYVEAFALLRVFARDECEKREEQIDRHAKKHQKFEQWTHEMRESELRVERRLRSRWTVRQPSRVPSHTAWRHLVRGQELCFCCLLFEKYLCELRAISVGITSTKYH